MALLGNPFVANVTKQMTPEETLQALRVDIAGELEAIIGYEAHAAATSDMRVKKVLAHIADEERQHVGELQQLLYVLSPNDMEQTEKGRQAVLSQQQQNFQPAMQ
ncbi:demethoxyubiquinone hydroxylase family protein [Oscillospiraceae bacterium CM]|nr:demethoxyubiquinone hydroxylase family protein [Oscillospiraceae bacterium CM]